MKKLSITLISALLFFTASAQNNNDELDKQVEVTKDYIPDVNRAAKLSIAPRMVDTVTLRPEIDYSINSTAWIGNFGIAAINPVKLNSTSFKTMPKLYVKAGLGYPLNSVLDSYYVDGDGSRSIYGAVVNHRGDYSKIKNDRGNSISSPQANNRVGLFGATTWNRMELGGDLNYNYDMFSDYGQFELANTPILNYGPLDDAITIGYNTTDASLWFGNDFSDMDNFNFRIYADAYYLSSNSDASEVGLNAGLKIGQRFGGQHSLLFALDYDLYSGGGVLSEQNGSTLRVTPQYVFKSSHVLLELGVEIAVDDKQGYDSKVIVFPEVKFDWNISDGSFIPFFSTDSRIQNNNYKNSVAQNPYILAQPTGVESTKFYDFRGGIKGNISPTTTYKVSLGYTALVDYQVIGNLYKYGSTSRFIYIPELTDGGDSFSLGAEIAGQINNRFFYDISANLYNNSMSNPKYEQVSGMANYDVGVNFNYNICEKFRAKAGLKVLGDRYFYVLNEEVGVIGTTPTSEIVAEKVDPVADFNIGLDMDVNKQTTVFLEVHNVFGSKLYQFNHYRSVGLSCTAGVKLTF